MDKARIKEHIFNRARRAAKSGYGIDWNWIVYRCSLCNGEIIRNKAEDSLEGDQHECETEGREMMTGTLHQIGTYNEYGTIQCKVKEYVARFVDCLYLDQDGAVKLNRDKLNEL